MTRTTDPDRIPEWQREFVQRHTLDSAFLPMAQTWFTPLAHSLADLQQRANRPMLEAAVVAKYRAHRRQPVVLRRTDL